MTDSYAVLLLAMTIGFLVGLLTGLIGARWIVPNPCANGHKWETWQRLQAGVPFGSPYSRCDRCGMTGDEFASKGPA